jgi:hypothetical protein
MAIEPRRYVIVRPNDGVEPRKEIHNDDDHYHSTCRHVLDSVQSEEGDPLDDNGQRAEYWKKNGHPKHRIGDRHSGAIHVIHFEDKRELPSIYCSNEWMKVSRNFK